MSRIRGKNTKPEMVVRRYLHANRVGYRLHKELPGKPDITITKDKLAIFVNGCFWHAHEDCNNFRIPKTRADFWQEKLTANAQRDSKNYSLLKESGWHVVTVWECELKEDGKKRLRELLDVILVSRTKATSLPLLCDKAVIPKAVMTPARNNKVVL